MIPGAEATLGVHRQKIMSCYRSQRSTWETGGKQSIIGQKAREECGRVLVSVSSQVIILVKHP